MNLLQSSVVVTSCGHLLVITDTDGRLFGVAIHDRSHDRFSVSLCGEDTARPARRRRNEAQQRRRLRKALAGT
jgi:hypothetical protein